LTGTENLSQAPARRVATCWTFGPLWGCKSNTGGLFDPENCKNDRLRPARESTLAFRALATGARHHAATARKTAVACLSGESLMCSVFGIASGWWSVLGLIANLIGATSQCAPSLRLGLASTFAAWRWPLRQGSSLMRAIISRAFCRRSSMNCSMAASRSVSSVSRVSYFETTIATTLR
jgi:hypothetical protein